MAKRTTAARAARGSHGTRKAGASKKAGGRKKAGGPKKVVGRKKAGASKKASARKPSRSPVTQAARPRDAGGILVEKVVPRDLSRRVLQPPLGVTVTEGIDVSHHNGPIAWLDVAAAGQRYVFIKASEGVTVVDTRFALNWAGARAAGLLRGAYHYFRPKSSPIGQADHFFSVVGALDRSDLPPVLDLEERTGWIGTPASRLQLVQQFLDRVEFLFKRRAVVYTSRSFMNEFLGGSRALGGHALWVVDYGQTPPRMPPGWTGWTLWQYAEQGRVAGVAGAVDVDWFRGDLQALHRFASSSSLP